MKRAFTLIETIIVIAIIAIMSAITIPVITNAYDNSKQQIIDIYNGVQIQVIDVDTNEVIYQGEKENASLDGYTLVDVQYGEYVIMYVSKTDH